MSITRYPISWLTSRVKGLEEAIEKTPIFNHIFTNNCYIAGGFARKLLREGVYDKKILSSYFKSGSDVDIYAENIISQRMFFEDVHLRNLIWYDSITQYAKTANVMHPYLFEIDANYPIRLQLITKAHGSPKKIIEGFDFANCKIAFNKNYVWVDDRVEQLEKNKKLQIDKQGMYVTSRILKYFKRHDYLLFEERSRVYVESYIAKRISEDYNNTSNIQHEILKLSDQVVSDKTLVNLISSLDHKTRLYVGYEYLEECISDISSYIPRYTISGNIAEFALNARKAFRIKMPTASLIEIEPIKINGDKINSIIFIKTFNNFMQCMLPNGELVFLKRECFKRVVSKI